MPDFATVKGLYSKITSLIKEDKILSAYAISGETLESALCKMTFGNRIGIKLNKEEYLNVMFSKGFTRIDPYLQFVVPSVPRTTKIFTAIILRKK